MVLSRGPFSAYLCIPMDDTGAEMGRRIFRDKLLMGFLPPHRYAAADVPPALAIVISSSTVGSSPSTGLQGS